MFITSVNKTIELLTSILFFPLEIFNREEMALPPSSRLIYSLLYFNKRSIYRFLTSFLLRFPSIRNDLKKSILILNYLKEKN